MYFTASPDLNVLDEVLVLVIFFIKRKIKVCKIGEFIVSLDIGVELDSFSFKFRGGIFYLVDSAVLPDGFQKSIRGLS